MRRATVLVLHGASVLAGFLLVLEGPDLLLFALLDVRLWLLIGFTSGLLTLPVLRWVGVGFAPPWTWPRYGAETPFARVVAYHLTCSVAGAWLWTEPTRRAVAWVHARRGLPPAVGAVPTDVVSVAAGVALAELVFFLPALVLVARLSAFRTGVDLASVRAADLLSPGVAAVGGYLLVRFPVSVAALVATNGP